MCLLGCSAWVQRSGPLRQAGDAVWQIKSTLFPRAFPEHFVPRASANEKSRQPSFLSFCFFVFFRVVFDCERVGWAKVAQGGRLRGFLPHARFAVSSGDLGRSQKALAAKIRERDVQKKKS